MRRSFIGLVLPALLVAACSGGDPTEVRDGGVATDAGPRRDSGFRDAGPPRDAGFRDAGFRDAGPVRDAGPRIRIVAANLSSGNFQSYDPGEGIRILRGLSPSVVLIQEFNYLDNEASEIEEMVEAIMGAGASFYRGETGNIPNGVLSEWPILEAGTWEDDEVGNRGFTWARIDVPGDQDLWAVSVHLLTANAGTRNREATQLVELIRSTIPDADLLVVGGDLNTNTRDEIAIQTLSAVVGSDKVPVDQDGNDGTNEPRSRPYDWVIPDPDLEALHLPVVIGAQSFAEGLVFDTRIYTPLSDVAPAMRSDSDAPQMQHMAVVRDFAVP